MASAIPNDEGNDDIVNWRENSRYNKTVYLEGSWTYPFCEVQLRDEDNKDIKWPTISMYMYLERTTARLEVTIRHPLEGLATARHTRIYNIKLKKWNKLPKEHFEWDIHIGEAWRNKFLLSKDPAIKLLRDCGSDGWRYKHSPECAAFVLPAFGVNIILFLDKIAAEIDRHVEEIHARIAAEEKWKHDKRIWRWLTFDFWGYHDKKNPPGNWFLLFIAWLALVLVVLATIVAGVDFVTSGNALTRFITNLNALVLAIQF